MKCGRETPAAALDGWKWCSDCRGLVVQRATHLARWLAAVVISLAFAAWVLLRPEGPDRFLMVYILVAGTAWFFLYKLIQRVAFEIIRGRKSTPAS
jgi:hypothetical protein